MTQIEIENAADNLKPKSSSGTVDISAKHTIFYKKNYLVPLLSSEINHFKKNIPRSTQSR